MCSAVCNSAVVQPAGTHLPEVSLPGLRVWRACGRACVAPCAPNAVHACHAGTCARVSVVRVLLCGRMVFAWAAVC